MQKEEEEHSKQDRDLTVFCFSDIWSRMRPQETDTHEALTEMLRREN